MTDNFDNSNKENEVFENEIPEEAVEETLTEETVEEVLTQETPEKPLEREEKESEENSYGGFSQKLAFERREEKAKKKGRGVKALAIVMSALFIMTLSAFLTYYFMNEKEDNRSHDFFVNSTPSKDESKDKSVNANIENEIVKAPERESGQTGVEYTGEVLTRQQLIEFANPSVVGIKTQVQGYSYFTGATVYEGVGSGFILTESGYIVTNCHVIEDAMAIKVILENGNEYEATLVGSDELSDLAVLKIEPEEELHTVVVGDSDMVVAGDSVIAIGCPAGIEFSGTATSGMVSMARREIAITDSYGRVQKTMYVIQIDAPINPGNSGGPLLNDRGEVIGINTLKLSSTAYEGIGFALPINGVMEIVNQLCEKGVVVNRGAASYVKGKAALGITYNGLTEAEAEYYQVPRGVLVILATPGGAAQKSGIKGGDIIMKFNDTEIVETNDLISCLAKSNPYDEVTLTLWRDGAKVTVDVVLGESN